MWVRNRKIQIKVFTQTRLLFFFFFYSHMCSGFFSYFLRLRNLSIHGSSRHSPPPTPPYFLTYFSKVHLKCYKTVSGVMEVGLISRTVRWCPASPTPWKPQCLSHRLYPDGWGGFRITMKIFMFRAIGRGFELKISKEGRSVKALLGLLLNDNFV